jgi:hypothetical protein
MVRVLVVNSLHFMKKLFYHESTKEKKNFVLLKFRVFVINHFGFPDKSGFTLRSNRLVRVRL